MLRKTTRLKITDAAIFKIAELMAYTMGFNLFLTAAESFKELYSGTEHMIYFQYLLFGIEKNGVHYHTLVPFAWASIITGFVAFLLFLIPRTRTNWTTLNIGCVLIYASVYIEKGMGLIIPGLTPDTLGEIYVYRPSLTEITVAAGIFSLGALVFTVMLKAGRGIPARRTARTACMISDTATSPALASCSRTPPVSNNRITASGLVASARSSKPTSLAPWTSPTAPPMKTPSCAAACTGCPANCPEPTRTPSSKAPGCSCEYLSQSTKTFFARAPSHPG